MASSDERPEATGVSAGVSDTSVVRMPSPDIAAIGPGSQSTSGSSALRAASAWWNEALSATATTAMPVGWGKVEPVSTGPRSGRLIFT